MSALMFIGIGQSIFLALLILAKKSPKSFDYLLAAWLFISALQLVFFHLNFIDRTDSFVPLLLLGGLLAFVTGPLLYLYVIAIFYPASFRLWKQWYHLIPFLFFAANYLYFHFAELPDARVWVEDGYLHAQGDVPRYMGFYGLILAFFSCMYPSVSWYLLFRHRRRLADSFSYTDKISLDWLRNWIVLSVIGFWVSFMIIWAGEFEWVTMRSSFQIVSGYIVFNVIVIGFFGLRQGSIFTGGQMTNDDETAVDTVKYGNSSLTAEEEGMHAQTLEDFMNQEQPFLDAKLTIDELARQLSFSRHHLSQVINSQFEKNFFDYVNEYRVRAFEQQLVDPQSEHLTLLGMGLKSGFNSKSSFNQIVKKLRGVTPSELKKEVLASAR